MRRTVVGLCGCIAAALRLPMTEDAVQKLQTVQIKIGTPPRELTMALDTTSAASYIFSGSYDSSSSSTSLEASFASTFARDTVFLSDTESFNLTFELVTPKGTPFGYDGVLALGMSVGSDVLALRDRSEYTGTRINPWVGYNVNCSVAAAMDFSQSFQRTTFEIGCVDRYPKLDDFSDFVFPTAIEAMYNAGLLENAAFSIHEGPEPFLELGGNSSSNTKIKTFPFITPLGYQWGVNVTRMGNISIAGRFMLSNTVAGIELPEVNLLRLVRQFEGAKMEKGQFTLPCAAVASTKIPIEFDSNLTIHLHASQLLLGPSCDTVCRLAVRRNPGYSVLGRLFISAVSPLHFSRSEISLPLDIE